MTATEISLKPPEKYLETSVDRGCLIHLATLVVVDDAEDIEKITNGSLEDGEEIALNLY